MHAQKVADDVRANAAQEADRLVKEAQGRAELMMMAAQNRVEDAQREIDGLKTAPPRGRGERRVDHLVAPLHARVHPRPAARARVVSLRSAASRPGLPEGGLTTAQALL